MIISQYVFGTLGASLLGNMLAGKWINRAGETIIRASYGFKRSLIKIFNASSFFN